MPVRVRVRNFQSIADAEIVVDRFTVVTGANNSGKTATMRAIQGVFSNSPGDSYVRHGAERLSVELDFGDGQTVRWEKGGKGKPAYVVGGKTLHPGRGVPDEVAALGVQPISVGDSKVWPQVAPQFTGQVFLLDLAGSSVAEAVADVERVGKLTQALRLAESDKRAASSELKVRRKDAEKLVEEVRAYAGIDAVTTAVEGAEQQLRAAGKLVTELAEAEDALARLSGANQAITRYAGVRGVPLPPAATVEDAGRVRASIREAQAFRGRLVPARHKASSLAGVRGVHVPVVPAEVGETKATLGSLQALSGRVLQASAQATRAREAASAAAGVRLGTEGGDAAVKLKKALEFFSEVRRRIQDSSTEVERLRSSLAKNLSSLSDTEDEVRDVLGGLGTCPVCKTPVTGSHPH